MTRIPTGCLAVLLGLLVAGCATTTTTHKPASTAEIGHPADGFVPAANDSVEPVPVVVEALPPLPATGPIILSRTDCLERARRAGRLDGQSVAFWKLDRKVAELGTKPPGCDFSLDLLRKKLGLAEAAAIAQLGMRIALLEYRLRLAHLARAVDRACWVLHCCQAGRNRPASIQETIRREEAQAELCRLLALTPEEAGRLDLRATALPSLPPDLDAAQSAAAAAHPAVELARLREEIERRIRDVSAEGGERKLENRQRWLRAQQAVADTECCVRDEGATLLRHWQQAERLLTACRQSPDHAVSEAEINAGLARIDLIHWLAWSADCHSCASCPP